MLVEEGHLRLYDPVAGFIPSFRDLEVMERDGTRRKPGAHHDHRTSDDPSLRSLLRLLA
ncbi:MAG: hypothetical protein R3D34_15450 [Nitratireductor sp.]